MNEDRHVQLLQLGIEWDEALVIQILTVDVAANFCAAQAKLSNRALQLSCSHLGLLHRKIGKRHKAIRIILHRFRERVVDFLTQRKTLSGTGGIEKQERRNR